MPALQASRGERLVVGLTGYPNVGKSSTINALFGSKKTAVAPTPGKTKHFQASKGGGRAGGGAGGGAGRQVDAAGWQEGGPCCGRKWDHVRVIVPASLRV